MKKNAWMAGVFCLIIYLFAGCGGDDSASDAGTDAGPGPDTDTDVDTDTDIDTDSDTDTDSDVGMTLEVHPKVATILVLTWTQVQEADSVWVEYSFENDEWLASPERPGTAGEHSEVILGVPADTEVAVRVVSQTAGSTSQSETITGTNGSLPSNLPKPTVQQFDSTLASGERWVMGSVENTVNQEAYWESPWWIFIMDRNGRIVWYYHNPLDSRILFPKVAPDGTHIIYDEHMGGSFDGNTLGLKRRTLDLEYAEDIDLPDMNWCYDITNDDYVLYYYYQLTSNNGDFSGNGALRELSPEGEVREIWNCNDWMNSIGVDPYYCYTNTVNWSKERDSVLLSFNWDLMTVLEIDRQTGAIKSQWGNLSGSWNFSSSNIEFNLQHYPNITKDGTMLISTHGPGWYSSEQLIMEFEIDDENKTLTQVWSFGDGVEEFAEQGGEAIRLDNGNTLISYGTGGVIKELTPDKQVAWQVIFDAAFSPSTNNKLVGHLTLLDDLYALNQGPQ